MVYTREELLKAVRDAGRDGQPFTLGTVRDQLGLKTRDKRELKRFRSRFRECCNAFGAAGIEKLGPNTFRLTAPVVARPAVPARAVPGASRGGDVAVAAIAAVRSPLLERVGASTRQPRVGRVEAPVADSGAAVVAIREEPRTSAATGERAREAAQNGQDGQDYQDAQNALAARGASEGGRGGLGARVMSLFFGRTRVQQNTAATALSRLAVELQPNSTNFQYRCVDGEMRVSVAQTEARGRGTSFS